METAALEVASCLPYRCQIEAVECGRGSVVRFEAANRSFGATFFDGPADVGFKRVLSSDGLSGGGHLKWRCWLVRRLATSNLHPVEAMGLRLVAIATVLVAIQRARGV
ncbi:hypothetical protein E2562_030211 [Oryza meyeriana var. granulata]|uniref:Uncharacterized protein n=1 Tax=Oryza meyeriana var. granulata TaxID=110450 RepID=A0A6G1D9C3_9ORYZ|nr:hypothetical protein E2562_030211 [Oryza meyeriana var. granulata]